MTVIFHLIVLTTIIVIGIKIATSPGMIFEKIGYYCGKKVSEGHRIFEPLCACEWCMPSVYSFFGFLFATGIGVIPFRFDWILFFYYPLVVLGSSFFGGVLWLFYKTVDAYRDKIKIEEKYYTNMEKLTFFEIRENKRKFLQSQLKENEKTSKQKG